MKQRLRSARVHRRARPRHRVDRAGGRVRDVDAAFKAFWAARSPQDAAKVIPDIVKSGVSFADALKRLKDGRPYAATVAKGVVKFSYTAHGKEFFYAVNVPDSYDPDRRYQVRFQLHGGVSRESNRPRGDGSIGALAGAEQIYILPTSWVDAMWWNPSQLENLSTILDTVKRTYNVDENRVVVSGVSDGGTGAYYVAMKDTTPYASFLPLNGYILVLRSEDLAVGDVFPNNLRNKPFFVVNGGRDPLYPASAVGTERPAPEREGRRGRLQAAAERRAQHGVVAGGQGLVRGVCPQSPAQSPSRQADLGNRRLVDRQPRALAGHRQAGAGRLATRRRSTT